MLDLIVGFCAYALCSFFVLLIPCLISSCLVERNGYNTSLQAYL